MATNIARRYNPDSYYRTEIVNQDFDDMQRDQYRSTPIRTISYQPEYETWEKENDHVHRHPEQNSKTSSRCCCSKQCFIGLGIGLLIGIILVIAIAVPVGLIKRSCHSDTSSSTPNWIGTFQMDGSCATAACCCYTNEVTLSQMTNNQLQISGQVTGACSSSTSTSAITLPMPTTFQTQFSWFLQTIRLRLGADSSYISFVNINQPVCSANGLRTSYNTGSTTAMNLLLVMLVALLILAINI